MKFKIGDKVEITSDLCGFRGAKHIGKTTTIEGIKQSVSAYKLKDVEDIWYDDELKLIDKNKNNNVLCGKILEHFISVLEINDDVTDVEQLSINTERIAELNYNVIFEENKVTVIIDGEFKGVARCHPEDSYDEYTGFEIAFKRAEIQKLLKDINTY